MGRELTRDRGLRIRAALGALLLLFLFVGLAHSAAPNRIRRRLGDSAFSPLKIPGLKLWLDATQIQGVAGGGSLAAWPDLSPSRNSPVQGTGAQKPIYNVNVQNGRPAVAFNGTATTGMFMSYSSLALTNFTIVEVYSWNGTGLVNYMIGGAALGTYAGGSGTTGFGVFDGTNDRQATTKPTAWGISTCQNTRLYRDGVETAYSATGTNTGMTLTLLGTRTGITTAFFAGNLGEVLVYDSNLSVAAMTPLWAYLKSKWGTP